MNRSFLKVITSDYPPYAILEDGEWQGICFDILEDLQRDLNFDYIVSEAEDGKFGVDTGNGSFDGMIGVVQRGEADLAVQTITITAERSKVVSFTAPFFGGGKTLAYILKPAPPSFFQFLQPFSPDLWLATLICLALCTLVHAMLCFLESQKFNISQSAWYMWCIAMQAGEPCFPKSFAGKTLSAVWGAFCLIIISSYTANLAAFLSASGTNDELETSEDVLKRVDIPIYSYKAGATREFFKNNKQPVLIAASRRMEDNNWFWNSTSEFKQLLQEDAAIVSDDEPLKRFRVKHCDMDIKIFEPISMDLFGWAMRKGHPMLKNISDKIRDYTSRGKIGNLQGRYRCPQKTSLTSSALQIENTGGMFGAVTFGAIFSVVLGICMKIVNKAKKKKKAKLRIK